MDSKPVSLEILRLVTVNPLRLTGKIDFIELSTAAHQSQVAQNLFFIDFVASNVFGCRITLSKSAKYPAYCLILLSKLLKVLRTT